MSALGLGGEIGRRSGLKTRRPYGRAGSTPAPGTMFSLANAPKRSSAAALYA